MNILVTGCAGFIGSHLAERLCQSGHQVVGIDCLSDYYSLQRKEKNLQKLLSLNNFEFIKENLLNYDLDKTLDGIEVIYHQAAQAGIRSSWGKNFKVYADDNIMATQRLLETAKTKKLIKFVFASSSSVYGDIDDLPMREKSQLNPVSPYGVTKLAAEKLAMLYWKNFDLPVVCLRYFTVYGPRQRPDMAFSKFIKAAINEDEIYIYGDGEQTRDFTYIDDIVDANLACTETDKDGLVFNLGGGSRTSISKVLEIIEGIAHKKLIIKFDKEQLGDVKHTWADTSKAQEYLDFHPKIDLAEGLNRQYEWTLQNLDII